MAERKLFFMKQAFQQAKTANKKGEVPVGAVVVRDGKIIGRGHNSMIQNSDPGAHAEMIALRRAGENLKNYRLLDCDLYVTLEPCLMCFSALVHARISTLVYAADDPKSGIFTTGSYDLVKSVYNHTIAVESGVLKQQASEILKIFFQERRDAGAVERGG
ncbi:MAG: tRNA adenosine(34) deaminase TadA, partial [Candidatus Aminicenantes bacterium]|nr:tRNA adenosine(34) deaminase TadA [Candidatus Aminicenantes bacterium]